MGLLYLFPSSKGETDRLQKTDDGGLVLKTYGLPLIFWGYALGILAILLALLMASAHPLQRAMASKDPLLVALAWAAAWILAMIPLLGLGFLFYEKRITKKGPLLQISHHLFGLSMASSSHQISPQSPFVIEPFLNSPNLAKKLNSPQLRAFQNRGYFKLWAIDQAGHKIKLDRHSQKRPLDQLAQLLEKN